MMTGRERIVKTINYEETDRIPRDVWTTPYINMFKQTEFDRLTKEFPMDIKGAEGIWFAKSGREKGEQNRKGKYTDAYGCEWTVLEDGVVGEVKDPIIKTMADLDNYKMPWEMIDNANCNNQNDVYKNTDKFVLGHSDVRPYERMQFLMGTPELMMSMAMEEPLFFKLRDMIHDFNKKIIELVSAQTVDGVNFMDDWGSQNALLISPEMWRKYYKPMYKEYCDIIHAKGKYAFFHSDGFIEDIYEDLIEVGVDVVNSQLFCMDIEKIAEKYAGKITFWGELDRQHVLPFGTQEDVRMLVKRIEKTLLSKKKSGFIAQLSWENITSYENVFAAYDEFNKI